MKNDKHFKKNQSQNFLIDFWNNLKIRNKILSIVLLVAIVSVASITIYNSITLRQTTIKNTGDELNLYAKEAIQHSADIVHGSINSLEVLALSPTIIQVIEEANTVYANQDQAEIDQEIAVLDKAWQDGDPSIESLVQQIEQNNTSNLLRTFMSNFPEEVEIFVTDIQGVNVAMTERTGDYLQGDEGWWQGAYNAGSGSIYVGEVEYDESTGIWAINVGIPVYNQTETLVGILRGTMDISLVFSSLSQIRFGETGYAAILDNSGKILYAKDQSKLMQPAPENMITAVIGQEGGWRDDILDLEGNPAVIAFQPMQGDLADSLGWTIILEQDIHEVQAPIQSSITTSLILAFALALGLIMIGIIAANNIAHSVLLITQGAEKLAVGDVQLTGMDNMALQKLSKRGDELGATGRAFNGLIDYLKEMAKVAQNIADNNLSRDIQPKSDKDLLGNAFVQMSTNLKQMIRQLMSHSHSLNSASTQLAIAADQAGSAVTQITTTIQQVASGTQQQSTEINKTVNSTEQMARAIEGVAKGAQEQAAAVSKSSEITTQLSQVIQQVADNARNGASGASQATQTARQGTETVTASIEGMGVIKAKVDLSTQKVQEMGNRSEQIGAIINTIEDLASQTNLLALNAAIEAARAGEHGKGFAVVAEEVRKLAEKSTVATKEIGDLIQQVQNTVSEAITAMRESADEVDNGVERASQSGNALNDILAAVENVNSEVDKISNAADGMGIFANELVASMDLVSAVVEENTASTEQMSASSSEVTGAVENIASISEENSAAVEEVSASTEEMSAQVEEVTTSAQSLAEMAETLNRLVQNFILSEGESPELKKIVDHEKVKKEIFQAQTSPLREPIFSLKN